MQAYQHQLRNEPGERIGFLEKIPITPAYASKEFTLRAQSSQFASQKAIELWASSKIATSSGFGLVHTQSMKNFSNGSEHKRSESNT